MSLSAGPVYELAERHFEHGEYTEAEALYAKILEDELGAGSAITLLGIAAMERLAETSVLLGYWARAVALLGCARSSYESAGNHYAADYVCTRIAAVENARGMGGVAAEILRSIDSSPQDEWDGTESDLPRWEHAWQWLDISDTDRAVFFTRYYLEAGRVESYHGQYERSAILLKRGLAFIATSDAANQAGVPICLALSASKLEQGDFRTAALYLDMVPEDLSEQRQPGHLVQKLELRARLDLLLGDLGSAKRCLEAALEICSRIQFQYSWALAALNLCHVLVFLNQTARARELADQARGASIHLGDSVTRLRAEFLLRVCDERAQSLVAGISLAPSVGEMWVGSQHEPPAATPADQGPSPFDLPASPNYLALFEERSWGFFWYLSRRNWSSARIYLNELESVFLGADPPTDSLLIRTRLHVLDCMLAYYEGNYDLALDGLLEARPVLRQLGVKPELWQALRFVEWCYERLGRHTEADTTAREAAVVLSALSGSLKGAELAMFLLNKWTAAERYMAAEVQMLTALKRQLYRPGWLARFSVPWVRYRIAYRLAKLLDYADQYKGKIFERTGDSEPAVLPPKRASLLRLFYHSRRRVHITFIVLPDVTLIARSGWLSLDFGVSAVTRIQLRQWLCQWHEAVRDNERAKGRVAMRQLSVALQIDEALQSVPERVKAITFIPDDILHGLPFAALRYKDQGSDTPGEGKYIVEDFAFAVGFEWLSATRGPGRSDLGVVVGIDKGADRYEPLPGAAAEACLVRSSLEAKRVRVSLPRKKDEILNQLPAAGFFHIACHGEFRPDEPDASGLLLISPEGQTELLSMRDIAALDLHTLQQAVLSSCWSADNFILPGRWILSLPYTFWRAGARSVIASLWEVSDNVAGAVFEALYRNLDQVARDEALREVQVACINNRFPCNGGDVADPLFWAGFQVYADPTPLTFAPNGQEPP